MLVCLFFHLVQICKDEVVSALDQSYDCYLFFLSETVFAQAHRQQEIHLYFVDIFLDRAIEFSDQFGNQQFWYFLKTCLFDEFRCCFLRHLFHLNVDEVRGLLIDLLVCKLSLCNLKVEMALPVIN